MKVAEIRKLSIPELEKKFRDLGEELMNLRLRKQTGQVEKPHMLCSLRRERARINTILAEKSAQDAWSIYTMTDTKKRNNRKELLGIVRSKTGDKSLKVVYEYKVPHPLYKKEIRRKTTVHAHDEENQAGIGDRVRIMATRPLSKLKRWRVVSVVYRAPDNSTA